MPTSGGGGGHAFDIAGGLDNVLVNILGDDEGLAFDAELGQEALESLGLDLIHLQTVDNDYLALGCLGGQSGLKSQSLDLAVEGVAVISGLGGKCYAAVVPHGGACIACA